MLALGADSCRQGWAVVSVDTHGRLDLSVVPRLFEVVRRHPEAVVAVDIPIGLTDEPRDADVEARRVLGPASSSVFNAPPRTVVDEVRAGVLTSHAEADARSRAVSGKGLSIQTWNITAKVAEVDELVETDGSRVVEVHPEVSFRLLAGDAPLGRKRSFRGVHERLRLLGGFGVTHLAGLPAAGRLPVDDVLDAAVAAWTAHGAARGEPLRSYPQVPRQHDRGRPVAIWVRR